ncbi:CD40 ligand [Synchiropus picturatus]
MINTYQTSVAAPPLPPRTHRKQPVLIPTQLPTHGPRKPLIQFLVGVVLLHLFLSVTGFMYFYVTSRQPQQGEQTLRRTGEDPPRLVSGKANAFMAVKRSRNKTASALTWDLDDSQCKHVDCQEDGWLTIKQSGLYYVYSKVTFSKADSKCSLNSIVKLRKSGPREEMVMVASCSLSQAHLGPQHFPQTCTATQGQILKLENGDQLSLWVETPHLVCYEKGATTFGMFKL